MEKAIEIYNKLETLEGLKRSFEAVSKVVENVDAGVFLNAENGKWSIAQNLKHLILSTIPVASGLKLPKIAFSLYGRSKNGSRDFATLLEIYKEFLTKGVVATSKYSPEANEAFDKTELLESWKMIGPKFQERLNNWSESELDKYRVPHPALGKLTIREMMFFTIFHNEHHLNAIKKQINRI